MNILHLTDFHLDSKDYRMEALAEHINDALEEKGESFYPNILLLTGDYTEMGSSDQYKWFLDGFKTFWQQPAFSQVEHVMVLPGNHDFPWNVTDTRMDGFQNLSRNMDQGLTVTTSNVLMESMQKHMIKHIYIEETEYSFLLIGMNSMKIDSPQWPGIGCFEEEQLRTVRQLIDYYKKQGKKLRIMAAFHHHLVPVSVLERDTLNDSKKFSLTLDARRAINCFLDNGVAFAVHGHQHQPSVVTWADEAREDGKVLHIVSAGCLAGKAYTGEGGRSGFMLYSINPYGTQVFKAETTDTDSDRFRWISDYYFQENSDDRTSGMEAHVNSDSLNKRYTDSLSVFESQMHMMNISDAVRRNIDDILRDALTGNRDKRRDAHIIMMNSTPRNRKAMVLCVEGFLQSRDEYVRGEAYYCLGILQRSKMNKVEDQIVKGLEDESDYVKACCANVFTRSAALKDSTVDKLRQADDIYIADKADKARKSLHYYAQIAISKNS